MFPRGRRACRWRSTGAAANASRARRYPPSTVRLSLRSLLLLARIARSAGASRAEEQRLSVGQREIAAVGSERPVLGLIAVDVDFRARQQGVLRQPTPEQRVRRP